MATTIMSANNNVHKLLKKKEEAEQVMRIRMRSIRESTLKGLNEQVKRNIARLRSMFYEAAK